jgi:formamidopyrimidine-DNA glycosylase
VAVHARLPASVGRHALYLRARRCPLPDITLYIEALERRILGQRLETIRLTSPFVLRTAQPPVTSTQGREIRKLRRLGKRIALGLEGDLWLVIHLMIAGRLHWRALGAKLPGRQGLAAFDFASGTLTLTEAGPRSGRRSMWYQVRKHSALTTPADSRSWKRTRTCSARRSPERTTRSSGR